MTDQLDLIDVTPLGLWTAQNAPESTQAAKARNAGPYGWDAAGNCVWCGEAGRCRCDHTQQLEPFATAGRCLKCGKPVPAGKMFCSQSCKTAWSKSMNAYARRVERTVNVDGEGTELF